MAAAATLPLSPLIGAQAASEALPVPPAGKLRFRILRKGDDIGTHSVTFSRSGDALTVDIAVDILAKFGPIPVYRYTHRATETWRGGQFMSIASKTDHDGSPQWMRAERTPDGIVVEGSKTDRYVAPKGALTTTYWNRAMVQDRMIQTEDGRLFDVRPTQLGVEKVPLATGATVPAKHYNIEGGLHFDVWYDENDQWAHLTSNTNGTTIIYERL